LEGSEPAALRQEALKLASGWMWDERKVLAGLHVDVSSLDNGADAMIKVDDIRAIRRDSLLRPFDGEVKVYIIAHAHNMNVSAQNALLRILEEPPPYVRFVLLVQNAEALLPTVRSRCAVRRLLPGAQGEDSQEDIIHRTEAFVDALDDPWRRAAVAFSWDRLSRDSLQSVLEAVLACLRGRCLQDGLKPLYTETLDTVSRLLPSLELNASPGSLCGVLAVSPAAGGGDSNQTKEN
jgi:DNA polymerase-3 subunit delta'